MCVAFHLPDVYRYCTGFSLQFLCVLRIKKQSPYLCINWRKERTDRDSLGAHDNVARSFSTVHWLQLSVQAVESKQVQ
jgi:hypothetical protein